MGVQLMAWVGMGTTVPPKLGHGKALVAPVFGPCIRPADGMAVLASLGMPVGCCADILGISLPPRALLAVLGGHEKVISKQTSVCEAS